MTKIQKIRQALEELSKKMGVASKIKEQSFFMKLIGKILFFNPGFMDTYITTMFGTVYYPERLLNDDFVYCMVQPHELVHAADMKKKPWLGVLYLFPQLLALLFFLSLLAISYSNWHLLWLLCVGFIAPIPSYWRKAVEMRGYAMTLAVTEWRYGQEGEKVQEKPPEGMHTYFTGPDYYFMWPFKKSVEDELQMWLDRVHNNELQQHIELAEDLKRIFREV